MSAATDSLLAQMHWDAGGKTLVLSDAMKGLAAASSSLRAAFGSDVVTLTDATVAVSTLAPAREMVAVQGRAFVFGSTRTVAVEIVQAFAELETLLVLVRLPRAWSLRTGFPSLASADVLSGLQLNGALVIVSSGLAAMPAGRKVDGVAVGFRGAELRDGLQILGTSLVRGSGDLPATFWTDATNTGVAPTSIPDRTKRPSWVEVRADVDAGRLSLEAWWDATGVPEGMGSAQLTATGLELAWSTTRTTPAPAWLWELDVGVDDPLYLRAAVWPGFPPSFTATPMHPAPLGESLTALSSLAGRDLSALVPSPPEILRLRSIEYTAGQSLSFAVIAGDPRASGPHLLSVGPFTLRDVVYALRLPLGRGAKGGASSIEALVEVHGVDFAVRYEPGVLFSGKLDDPEGVPLGRLVENAVGVDLPFGLHTLTLRHASVVRVLDPGSTTVEIEIDGSVDLIPRALTLRDVRVIVDRTDTGARVGFGIRAIFAVGPVSLQVSAARSAEGGWLFEGQGVAPDGISLTELMDHIVHQFGADIPPSVPDVRLREVGVSYDTAGKALTLHAITSWQVDDDVPVVHGEHQVVLTLTVLPNPASGGRTAQFQVQWSFETAGGNRLAASSMLSSQAQSFSVDFQAPDAPLKFTDVVHDLGVADDVAIPGAELLDSLFQVSTLSLSYSRPGGDLDFAFTRPLGPGVLLLEFERDALQRRFLASWNASQPTGTIGVRDVFDLTGHGEIVGEAFTYLGGVGLGTVVRDVTDLLTFRELGFTWESRAGTSSFTVLARSQHAAVDETFVMVRTGTNGGLVTGVAFKKDQGFEDLPFVPSFVGEFIDGLTEVFHLEPTCVLISTVSEGHFVPPGFDAAMLQPTFGRPGVSAPRRPFGGAWMRLSKGVVLGARVRFGDHAVLRRVVDADELDVQLVLSSSQVALQACLDGSVTLGSGANSLKLADPMLRIALSEAGPEFDVGGTVELRLFGQLLHVEGWLSVSLESIEAHLELEGLPVIPIPMLFGVHFRATHEQPFYLEVGVQFEPPGLDLGIEGSFFIYTHLKEYTGHVTFVLEVVEILPQPLFVEFSIDELDLPGVLEAMTGLQWDLHLAEMATDAIGDAAGDSKVGGAARGVSSGIHAIEGILDHIGEVLSSVSIDDVLFRWADSVVNLPDGTIAMPGVALHGRVSLFGWHAFTLLEFSSGGIPALTGHFEAEPISLGGVLKIWGDGEGIRTAPASAADLKSGSSTAVVPANSDAWFIKPGGPVFHVSTQASPFLHASLHASLFGFLHADIQADVTDEGFAFDFRIGAGNAMTAELECHFWKDEGRFEAHGGAGLHLHGDLGPLIPGVEATRIHLDTDLEADMDLVVDGAGMSLHVRGEFNFQGLRLRVPELHITVSFSSLRELADHIWDRIKAIAHEIFEDVIAPIGKFFEDAGKEIAHVAVEAAHAVEEVAEAAATEIVHIADVVAQGVNEGVKAIEKVAEQVAAAAKQVVDHAAVAAEEAAAPLHSLAEELRAKKGDTVTRAVAQVEAIGVEIAAAVVEVAAFVADVAHQAEVWVGARLRDAAEWCAARLADARAAVERLAREADEIVHAIEQEIEALVHEIEELARKIKEWFENAGRTIEHAFVDAGHEVAHFFRSW